MYKRKYSRTKRKGASLQNVINYTHPKLRQGKEWYLDLKCYDPLERNMKRKKYMLDKIDKLTDRKKRATEIITNITYQLRNGWNPWADASSSRQYTLYNDVIDLYTRYLEKLHKAKVIKENTLLDYKKRLKVFVGYSEKRYPPMVYIYQLDQMFISDFLDYILID